MAHFICDWCNADFHISPTRRPHKLTFCSMDCKTAHTREQVRLRKPTHEQCPICRELFKHRPPSRTAEAESYCSQACYQKARRRERHRRQREKILGQELRMRMSELERKRVKFVLSRTKESPAQFMRRAVTEAYVRAYDEAEKERSATAQ